MRDAELLMWSGDFNYRIDGTYELVKELASKGLGQPECYVKLLEMVGPVPEIARKQANRVTAMPEPRSWRHFWVFSSCRKRYGNHSHAAQHSGADRVPASQSASFQPMQTSSGRSSV